MNETGLATAQRLMAQALDAVRAAAGPGAGDEELVAVLALPEFIPPRWVDPLRTPRRKALPQLVGMRC